MSLRATPILLLLALVSAGCLTEVAPVPEAAPDLRTDDASLRPITQSFSGTALATPATPQVQEFEFPVPSGAVGVNGSLVWDSPAARFRLELVDPRGDVAASGYPDASGALVVSTLDPPRPGTWIFRVTAMVAANVPFTVDATAQLLVPEDNVDRASLVLNAASFYEVNLILEENATFRFAFNSSAPVKWDVHSHPPEGVKYWHEAEGTTGTYTFTAPARGVYSVLWENPGALDVDLSYEIVGKFRIHSHAG